MLVYSRKPKPKYKENLTLGTVRESELMMAPKSHESESPDINLLIALKKKPWLCTLHPISKFISYNNLSIGFRAFTSNLDRAEIPKCIQEALTIPKWKDTVMEEMRTLEKK